jgi:cell shape-determining protein MreC
MARGLHPAGAALPRAPRQAWRIAMSIRSAIMIILIVAVAASLVANQLRRTSPRHVRQHTTSLLERIDRTVHDFDRLVAREVRRQG